MTAGHAHQPAPLAFSRPPEDVARRAGEDMLALMRRRRSVRHFSPDPVPRELIENAIRTAGTAPSGANQQPWSFVVIGDAAVKERLRVAAEHEEQLLYERRASDEYLRAIEPIGTDAIKPHITDAPYLIVVFEQLWGLAPDGTKRKHYYVRESVGIAVGMLITALHVAGLATLTHAPSPMGFLKDILGRPANEKPFLLLPVGYPVEGASVPTLEKKPLEEIATFI
jgi:nitroreductase